MVGNAQAGGTQIINVIQLAGRPSAGATLSNINSIVGTPFLSGPSLTGSNVNLTDVSNQMNIVGLNTINTRAVFQNGQFSSFTNQPATSIGIPLTYSSTEVSNGIALVPGSPSQIQVSRAGLYECSSIVQMSTLSPGTNGVIGYFQVNGVPVNPSAQRLIVPQIIGPTLTPQLELSLHFLLTLAANDVLEVVIASTDVGMTATALTSGPAPDTASIRTILKAIPT